MLWEPPTAHWPRSWIVAFCDADLDPGAWYVRMTTCKGFRHCFLLGYMPGSAHWLLLDWSPAGLQSVLLNKRGFDALVAHVIRDRDGVFVDFDAPTPKKRWKLPLLPLYCVNMVRHTLGITKFLVTPLQLHDYLLANGGRSMFRWS